MIDKILMFIFFCTVAVFGIAIGATLLQIAPFLWIFVIMFVGAIIWDIGSGMGIDDVIKNRRDAQKSIQHQDIRTGTAEDILKEVSGVQTGQTVRFGAYDWKVLAVEEGKALLLTQELVANKEYHNDRQARGAIWEKCTLRRWLNGAFFRSTFSPGEQALILETQVSNMDGRVGRSTTLAPTTDKLFLLSREELKRYLPEEKDRTARLAGSARGWWLRDSCGYDAYIMDYSPARVWETSSCVDKGIRPAMWIKIR